MPLRVSICLSLLSVAALLPDISLAYEQNGAHLAHQWFTRQAWSLFQHQFGASEIDNYIGDVQEYPNGANNRVTEGVFDEDVANENPFNDTAPFNRHFWDYNANTFAKTFDQGLLLSGTRFDAAPNRAVKYFTGGRGLTGTLDGDWGMAQNAQQDRGIVWNHQNNNKDRAYYWLGSAAHLLQDSTLPAHVLNDPHPTTLDQDPLHDWIDGQNFSMGFPGNAAFNDTNATRYENWRFHQAQGAVGRAANAASLDSSSLRSSDQLANIVWLDQGLQASIPANAQAQSLSLYNLFVETAGLADDYDSRDRNGQVDAGARRNNGGAYANWTRAELDFVGDVVATRAMRATAELFRYFYSQVDPTAPAVTLPMTSVDINHPTQSFGNSALVEATAFDDISGFDLDGFQFSVEQLDGGVWNPLPPLPASTNTILLQGLSNGLYRIRARVENGAGIIGMSDFSYLQVVPEPATLSLLLGLGFVSLGLRRTRGCYR